MSKSSIPHENLFEFTVQFLYEYRHADTVISFLKLIEAKGGKISNPEFLHQFMLRVLDEDSPFAYHLCRAISALDVSSDPQFPLRSILEALETRHKFQDIIDRAETSQLLPASLKDLPIDELQKAQTVLIHQVAHQYSIDHSRSCRSAQQQVNLLFKYLRARDLPIGPLFTRAVVRVCITRPMMERRWVSRRRVEAICRIVAKVEGTEVAGQVRSTFLDWRGGLITDSHRKLIELGGSGSAHVNTMRRLGLI
ncbi:hypothetical protein GQ43DRAFT_373404 [Delitschia confertaspora ATCC 74209]|uniref:Uncharacterized protein n=1 Tax=Delitschia confertaspora ATCC 74209 TaxID=1513339 RepID=A0A9P4JK71_9PLEO|nr:hypothetical protein GQ43DRAFT_373404 [Delitschia confertaspora ATCC 74209]